MEKTCTCETCARSTCSRRAAGIVCRNYKQSTDKKPVSISACAKGLDFGRVNTVRVTDSVRDAEGDVVRTVYDVPVIDYMTFGLRPARFSAAPYLTGGMTPALKADEVMDDSWKPVVVSVDYDEKLDPFQLALAMDGVDLVK